MSLSCDQPDLPTDERNLVVKIGNAWAQAASKIPGNSVGSVRAVLGKRIPFGAGLGGGSSDGSLALMGLNALWNTNRAAEELSAFAARFGSDLSFFFHGPSSVCTGRGEIVQPIPRPAPRAALLLLPPIEMPTAQVYRRFDEMKLGRDKDLQRQPDWLAWSKLPAGELLPQLVNDLETAAFEISPPLASLRREMETLLGRPVRMSGSGSSLFTIYDTLQEAGHGQRIVQNHPGAVRVEAVELAPQIVDRPTTELA